MRHSLYYAASVFYAVMAFVSLCLVEHNLFVFSGLAIIAFWACIRFQDLAEQEKKRIRSNADEDRPE